MVLEEKRKDDCVYQGSADFFLCIDCSASGSL